MVKSKPNQLILYFLGVAFAPTTPNVASPLVVVIDNLQLLLLSSLELTIKCRLLPLNLPRVCLLMAPITHQGFGRMCGEAAMHSRTCSCIGVQ